MNLKRINMVMYTVVVLLYMIAGMIALVVGLLNIEKEIAIKLFLVSICLFVVMNMASNVSHQYSKELQHENN
jgi:hypothetical protein